VLDLPQEASGIDPVELLRKFFERRSFDTRDLADTVFIAEKMGDALIEDLPRKTCRLFEDCIA
jgi:hypothetical protein